MEHDLGVQCVLKSVSNLVSFETDRERPKYLGRVYDQVLLRFHAKVVRRLLKIYLEGIAITNPGPNLEFSKVLFVQFHV